MTKTADETALGVASGMLETGLVGLRKYITHRSKRLGPDDATIGDATEFAHLLTKVATVTGELRKAEAAARKDSEELDEARVLEWFLRIEPTRQGRFLRELGERSKKGSGLA